MKVPPDFIIDVQKEVRREFGIATDPDDHPFRSVNEIHREVEIIKATVFRVLSKLDKADAKDELEEIIVAVNGDIADAGEFLEERGEFALNRTSREDPVGDDPYETRSFTRGKLVGMYTVRDRLKRLLEKL